ncbi:LysR family transcriptional regulator substrate-binding protein [Cellulomonas fengjieae]|uniref:LysR family transcriptional regulator substrate-binding protein n=1 Tax=Cellulomonas fengjieae TaxID=2819978 RepID=A0ABS3SHD1_9CELL|nr:LysR family transcriptional regulator substrate-binding protein [Cellulomonas fengjieae]MBO3085149.1 LysR family transcriptional regulator substrate-binding protein [Cellulomonas fengjieae]QVI66274.1 LysR family transcriptional regulator substrate-binding protein [Cellulomonas fengjieae]
MSTAPDRPAPAFRIALVPGVNPDRWLRVWQERLPDVPIELVHTSPDQAVPLLRAGAADAALVRLPADGDDLSTIPLYTEATVVMVTKDHVISVVDEVDAADLEDETLVVPLDDQLRWTDPPGTRFAGGAVDTTADAVDLVAAGVGVLVLPQSLGRLHQRRGLVARPVRDAPGSAIGLAWVTDRYDDLTEEFIGIVRGRTATSSRGRGAPPPPEPPKQRGASGARASGKGASGSSSSKGTSAPSSSKSSSKGTSSKKPNPRRPRPGR